MGQIINENSVRGGSIKSSIEQILGMPILTYGASDSDVAASTIATEARKVAQNEQAVSKYMSQINSTRSGCKDVWNAYMCDGADFSHSNNDIPLCPTTATDLPAAIIPWDEAKRLYKNALARKDNESFCNAFVCWFIDDYKFDGPRGIWHDSAHVLKVLRHFAGAITPDFSTYRDFPEPLKLYNTYRMRAFGYWLGQNGIAVINNVRWGTSETWNYCWDGIPKNSMVCIGTAGGSPRKLVDRKRFEKGLDELIRVLNPHTILVYGSAKYPCFDSLLNRRINITAYPGSTALAFEKRRRLQ